MGFHYERILYSCSVIFIMKRIGAVSILVKAKGAVSLDGPSCHQLMEYTLPG